MRLFGKRETEVLHKIWRFSSSGSRLDLRINNWSFFYLSFGLHSSSDLDLVFNPRPPIPWKTCSLNVVLG